MSGLLRLRCQQWISSRVQDNIVVVKHHNINDYIVYKNSFDLVIIHGHHPK